MPKSHRLSFNVAGASCAGCVNRIEKAVLAAPGVTAANMNLATGMLHVDFKTPADAKSIVRTLDNTHYPAQTQTDRITVDGMSCASCVGRVETLLSDIPGVVSAQVNLASGIATITGLSGTNWQGAVMNALHQSGYTAVSKDDPSADTSSRPEKDRLRGDVWRAAALTLPVLILEMGGHLMPSFHHWIAAHIGLTNSHLIQLALCTATMAGPGRQFFVKAVPGLVKGTPDMNALVALGTGAAFCYSAVSTLFPSLLPAGAVHVYFESAAVIITLILIGRWMEARAKGRTGDAIRQLLALRPATASVQKDGVFKDTDVKDIQIGDIIALRPGERVATDGIVTDGNSTVDESMLTGEAIPVPKAASATVVGGTVNGTGHLEYKATHIGRDTVLSRIVHMVEEAQNSKLPIQSLLDRVTAWFVPAVLAIAILTFAIWLALGPAPSLGPAIVAAVSVLIIACPCAMGLATPTSVMVGTGRAAELGVLFRTSAALQQMQSVKTVAFDKTGTLTQGTPAITDQISFGMPADALLAITAAVEAQSEHPLARAFETAADAEQLALPQVEQFSALAGLGLRATVQNQSVLIGSVKLLIQQGVKVPHNDPTLTAWMAQGWTVVLVALKGQLSGAYAISDPIKPEAHRVIQHLKSQGQHVAMLTGDTHQTAAYVAKSLGIEDVQAGLSPADKVTAINRLKQNGSVAFVGDGLNDAPALATADVGIAIGAGTDIAIESADIVLSADTLSGVVNARELSRRTMGNIRQNLGWAFGYNVLLIPVAAGALYPYFGILLSPMLGAFAMAASSVLVVSNALRLRFLSPTNLSKAKL